MPAFFSNLFGANSSSPSYKASSASKREEALKSLTSKRQKNGYNKSQNGTQHPRHDTVKASKISKGIKDELSSTKAQRLAKRKWKLFDLLNLAGLSSVHVDKVTLEGDTLVDDDISIKCEGGGDKNEFTAAVEETLLESYEDRSDSCLPFEDRAFQPDDERIQDWSDDEVWIFNKLVMRGQEPILPYELASEFPSWPDILFTNDANKIVINNINRSITNLASAFNRFLYEGVSLRCRLQSTINVEPPIERALRGLHKFIMQDGHLRLKGCPPLTCVAAAAADEDVAQVVDRCMNKMYKAGQQWRNWLSEYDFQSETSLEGQQQQQQSTAQLPTIYGYVVKHSVLAIMTWDSCFGDEANVTKPVRTIGTYDWKIEGQDVWHALAVAIVECKARDYLMKLDKEGLLGQDRVESDPDL